MKIRITGLAVLITLASSLALGSAPLPAAASSVPKCNQGALAMSIGRSNGAAGTNYYPLVFTNVTTHSCTLSGIPTVRALTAINSMGGPPLGLPARPVNRGVKNYAGPVVIPPRGHASAAFGVIDTGALSARQCVAKNARSISVSLQGRMYWASLHFLVCTKMVSTTISGVVMGTTGVA
jgi:hypothetical protein